MSLLEKVGMTWKEIADQWQRNLESPSNEWKPIGSSVFGEAIIAAKNEVAQLEAEKEEMRSFILDHFALDLDVIPKKWGGEGE